MFQSDLYTCRLELFPPQGASRHVDERYTAGMAQKTIVQLTDDIEGTEATETLTFSLDGVSYEIDLSDKNAAKLRKALDSYVGAARRVRGSSGRNGRRTTSRTGDTSAIREWAAAQGIEVSQRGRISADVKAQYEAAH